MTDKEKQELYENICNDINCGTYILAPQYVDKLLAELEERVWRQKKKMVEKTKKISDLEKENAELKAFRQDCVKLTEDNVVMARQRAETSKQLTKAKEIIRELLSSCFGYNSKTVNYKVKAKAEQFLDEVEK